MAHYGTEADFTAYCERMGYTPAAGGVDPALERATAYLDGRYGAQYPGVPTGGYAQELGWPRTGVTECHGFAVPPDAVPKDIEYASYECALRELSAPGSLSPDVITGQIKKSVSVDGAVSVTYADAEQGGAVASQRPTLTIVDDMLSCLLSGGGSGISGRSKTVWLQRT